MKNIMIFVLVLVLISCKKEAKIYVDNIPAEGISLNTWQILGPFQTESKDYYLGVDNLKQFGFDENTISYNDFLSIRPKNTSPKLKNLLVASGLVTDFNQVYQINQSASISGNVYCMCTIKSSNEKNLKLNFSSQDGSKVWINHQLILNSDGYQELDIYRYYLDIHLMKGDNILLVKINNIRKREWKSYASLENESFEGEKKHRKTFSAVYGIDYLKRSVILNDSLKLIETLPLNKYSLEIAGSYIKPLMKDSISDFLNTSVNISNLKNGLYNAKFFAFRDTFTQVFYKGDIVDTIQKTINKINKFILKPRVKHSFDAVCFRVKHLLKPNNMGTFTYEKRDWDKKLLSLFNQLQSYNRCLESQETIGRHTAGPLLKAYKSKIDNNLQYYRVQIPNGYKKENPVPVFVAISSVIRWYPSYLESWRVADVCWFESFGHMANKYNMIVLQPHNRTIDLNRNTIDEADFWEVFEDLRKDYNIDTSRIYLNSECQSCEEVLRFAVKYPDKFAAIATVAPNIVKSNIDNVWVQHNNPINYFRNISNLPFVNFHSKYNPHTPAKKSEELNQWAQEAGLTKFEYHRTSEISGTETIECLDEIFRFCKKFSVISSPSEVNFSTSQMKYNKSFWITLNEIVAAENATIEAKISNNTLSIKKQNIVSYTIDLATLPFNKDKPLKVVEDGKVVYEAFPQTKVLTFNPLPKNQLIKNSKIEGPFANVFTNSFIVVPGTNGKKAENEKIKAMADTLNRYWKLRYFDGLRIKPDKDITKKDIAESNLILLGGTTSNLVFEKIKGMLPVAASNTAITIGGRLVKGDNLGYYVIYPNPLNPKKYVAIISYNNTNYISLGFENFGSYNFDDVSNYGWFDYKVWDAKNPSNSVMEGYFDSRWHLN